MMQTPCQHQRTRIIAEDKDAKYVECLACGEILETGEMEKKEVVESGEPEKKEIKNAPGFDESLSDA